MAEESKEHDWTDSLPRFRARSRNEASYAGSLALNHLQNFFWRADVPGDVTPKKRGGDRREDRSVRSKHRDWTVLYRGRGD